MTRRVLVFAYGVLSYLTFFATFLYAFGFVTNRLVPRSIDGPSSTSTALALAIDGALLALFALQHSVMARRWFKDWLTRRVPPLAERPTYVLASSLALILLFAAWQPLGGAVWQAQDTFLRAALEALGVAGWLMVLGTTFLINHFDLFGLRHAWLALRGLPYTPLRFGTPGPYKLVRHPLYVGWLVAFWATPDMSAGRLLFAALCTGYILVAIQLEESDLAREHGERYARYREQVGMLFPRLLRRARPALATQA